MALTPGTRLGVYAVTTRIGEGGMGQVYCARDTQLKGSANESAAGADDLRAALVRGAEAPRADEVALTPMHILQIVLFVVFLAGAVVGLALRRSGGAVFVPLGLASALVQATTFGIKNVMLQVAAILVFVACTGVVFWNGRHAPWRAGRLDIILGVGSILCIALQNIPGMTVEASQILLALLLAFGLGFVGRMFYVAFQMFRAAYRL